MKKIISLLLVLIMLPVVSFAERTERRALVEFVELYSSRFAVYANESGIDFDTSIYASIPPWKKGDLLIFETSAGSAGVNLDTYDLHDLVMTLYSLSDDDTGNELCATSCLVAISALEYDALYEVGPVKKSAIEDAAAIFDEIGNGLEEAIEYSMNNGGRFLVYCGNYNYFIEYVSFDTHDFIYLIAEERK